MHGFLSYILDTFQQLSIFLHGYESYFEENDSSIRFVLLIFHLNSANTYISACEVRANEIISIFDLCRVHRSITIINYKENNMFEQTFKNIFDKLNDEDKAILPLLPFYFHAEID